MNEDDDLIQEAGVRVVGGGSEPDPAAEPSEEISVAESGFLDEDEPPKPKPAAEPEKPKETAAERRDRARLEAELAAAREEVNYWRTNKLAAPAPAPEPKPKAAAAPRDQVLTVDQQLDLLVKDPAAYFKQAGMVTQEEAERIAEQKAEERAAALLEKSRAAQREEAKLLQDFKGIDDPDSEMFKATEQILRKHGVDEKRAGDALVLRLAAEAAKAQLEAQSSKSRGKQERIAAQGPAGRRVSGETAVLSETTRLFAEKLGIKDMSLVEREANRMRGGR